MKRPATMTALAAVLMMAADGPPRPDSEAIRGGWVLVASEFDGSPIPRAGGKPSDRILLIFSRDSSGAIRRGESPHPAGPPAAPGLRLLVRGPGLISEATVRLDPSGAPKAYDSAHVVGPHQGRTFRGIYELEGETLRICLDTTGQGRPTSMATWPGSGRRSGVYKWEPLPTSGDSMIDDVEYFPPAPGSPETPAAKQRARMRAFGIPEADRPR